jgi:hypothetical protein
VRGGGVGSMEIIAGVGIPWIWDSNREIVRY